MSEQQKTPLAANDSTDLSTVAPNNRKVAILHPATGEEIGLTIELLPLSDPKVRAVKRRVVNERLQRNKKMTAEAMEKSGIELICAAAVGWEWGKDANGKPLTFKGKVPEFDDDKRNLRTVLKELDWVRAQLDDALGDEGSFFQN
jgi:hypothetical protein